MKSLWLMFIVVLLIIVYAIVNFVKRHGLLDFATIVFVLICFVGIFLFFLAVKREDDIYKN